MPKQSESLPQSVGLKRTLLNQSGYVMVSNALIWGFPYLSEPALKTYLLLESLNWDPDGPGEVWYSRDALANLRGCPHQTLSWHFRELLHFGLLRKVERPGDTNLWEIPPLPRLELQRAVFVRNCLTKLKAKDRPTDMQEAFRAWCERCKPDFVRALAKVDNLVEDWQAIRSSRQSKSKRRPEHQAHIDALRDKTKPLKTE